MFHRIHQKLGTAGFIISIVALVAALGGGAYAASGGLNGKQKKEVEKIAKKYSGKPGAAGATGPAGPTGPAGAAGKNGTDGTDGTDGAPGSPGAPGKSGTFGEGTLATGVTETGAYSVDVSTEYLGAEAISFPTPLAGPLDPSHVVYVPVPNGPPVTNNPDPIHCSGSVAAPTAAEGYLCVYEAYRDEGISLALGPINTVEQIHGANAFGFRLLFVASGTPNYHEFEMQHVYGSWAVSGG